MGSVSFEEVSHSIIESNYLFIGWAVCVGVMPIPATKNLAIWRFWAELFPLLSIIGITAIFWFIDKKR